MVNAIVPMGSVVESREVQVRRWLRPDIRVTSPEGLVVAGQPEWRITTNRDPIDTVGWKRLGGWGVGLPGFVQWCAIDQRVRP